MNEGEPGDAEHELRRRAKLALRKQMRAVRATLPAAACEARSSEIAKRVLALPEIEAATIVLAFASIGNEVRTGPIIEGARRAGKRIALPRVVEDELFLHAVEPDTTLVEGAFGVPEPSKDAPSIRASDVEFALIPALAVDPDGYRIGYGGGYYDRLLPSLIRASTCTIAYDFQLITEVPKLPFDAAVDLIVTDARVIRAVV
ncbi:MAG: 5-formyltetrahydrofolate cyclo-ligase [Deltaproteobacteria bacterium]|nr:5-formyltetrahydrofolate cyclo-ligase [Deltaproteobacteria bacterium]